MRSFWYGYLTSLYGDIPYSEAMQAEQGIFMPVYDNQRYLQGILDDLKSANELLAPSHPLKELQVMTSCTRGCYEMEKIRQLITAKVFNEAIRKTG